MKPLVALASTNDLELGSLRAPIDGVVNYAQVDTVVRRALDLDTSSGCLRNSIKPDDWVVIKPNIVTSITHKRSSYWHEGKPHPGQVTDLRVIKSLIGYLIGNCRPRRITIAEGGAEWKKSADPQVADGWTVQWPEFDHLSYTGIVETYNRECPGLVDIVDLNEDAVQFLPVPDPKGSGISALQRIGEEERPPERFGRGVYKAGTGDLRAGYYVPQTILSCDKLISVPALKTHLSCGTTLVLKNFVGILPEHPSGVVVKFNAHAGDIQKGFVDLFSYHPADYSLVEGFWATEGNGPQWGENVRHNVVMAGSDPVAVDAVAAAVMGFNPVDLDYLHYAVQKKFGVANLMSIHVVGRSINEVRRNFCKGTGRKGVAFLPRGNRLWQVRAAEESNWRTYESSERYIDLAKCMGEGVQRAYAMVTVVAEHAQTGQVWAAADGKTVVELNGEKVWVRSVQGPFSLVEHKSMIDLKAGYNTIVVQMDRSHYGFGFSVLLCDEFGNTLPGIEYVIV